TMEDVTASLEKIAKDNPTISIDLMNIKDNIDNWLKKAKATNSLFDFMMDSDNISSRSRLDAKRTVNEVKRQAQFFIQTVVVKTDRIDESFLLPSASFAEWSSIFQNVIINSVNAINATDGSGPRIIDIKTERTDNQHRIVIQDTGCGLDLSDSVKYFEPFERGIELSEKEKKEGFGGTGLGLAIVKLIARRIGCGVKFVPPDTGFNTSFVIEWEETEDEDEDAENSDN
ncbi:MAG: ATP-binding protein, partial [Erysipelotrichales bacterium]